MKIKFNSIVALLITTMCLVSGKDSVVLAQSSRTRSICTATLTWYRVEFPKSKAMGWIREDFLRMKCAYD